MKVVIKKFTVDMEVKSKGIEFEVRHPDDSGQVGDCYLTMSGLVWCEGKTSKAKGVKISWEDFMQILKSSDTCAAAIAAAKAK
ncbi:MAG: hypothetical protein NTW87_14795 [Planctomycetota bacterium]|nr:hypothetical protein [Planctomycetota bacterium]